MPSTDYPSVDPTTGLPTSPSLVDFGASLAGSALLAFLFLAVIPFLPKPAPPPDLTAGRALYKQSCAACHGAKGEGGIGKPLTGAFVTESNDEALLRFIEVGRTVDDPANTTKQPMLPKGGNPALTTGDLKGIVGVIRSFSGQTAAGPGLSLDLELGGFGRFLLLIIALGTAGLVSASARAKQ
jgi:mono/diheme cytochrome c family protein